MKEQKMVYVLTGDDPPSSEILGWKPYQLANLGRMGVPIPGTCVLTASACDRIRKNEGKVPNEIRRELKQAVGQLNAQACRKEFLSSRPLLLSVHLSSVHERAAQRMVAACVGMNDAVTEELAAQSTDPVRIWTRYCSLLRTYGIAREISAASFDAITATLACRCKAGSFSDLTVNCLRELSQSFLAHIRHYAGKAFPDDPMEQLVDLIEGALKARTDAPAPALSGCTLMIRQMVFGDRDLDSGCAEAFTRNPTTGMRSPFGVFQPQMNEILLDRGSAIRLEQIGSVFPGMWNELERLNRILEAYFRDIREYRVVIEDGMLYLTDFREDGMAVDAAVQLGRTMLEKRMLFPQEKSGLIRNRQIGRSRLPRFEPEAQSRAVCIGHGQPTYTGSVSGRLVFSAEEAALHVSMGERVILALEDCTCAQYHKILSASGFLLAGAGFQGFDQILAYRRPVRALIRECEQMRIDREKKLLCLGQRVFHEGDALSLDGFTGRIYEGFLPTRTGPLNWEDLFPGEPNSF